jgi:hypothetical protein
MAHKLSNISTQPDVRAAFMGWRNRLTARIVRQHVLDGGIVENEITRISFSGHMQPARWEEVNLHRTDGERSWEWWALYVPDDSPAYLETNDRIEWNGELYKVMERENWGLNGYRLYNCIRDYDNTWT